MNFPPPPPPPGSIRSAPPRSLNFGLFVLAGLWVIAANRLADSAAQGIIASLPINPIAPLLAPAFLLFLLVLGFNAISRLHTHTGSLLAITGLPKRPTQGEEFQRGIALGWAITLIAVLPMMLIGALHPEFWLGPRNWFPTVVSLATIAIGTLAAEVAFRGYLYSRLTAAIGTVAATLVVSFIYAITSLLHPNSTGLSMTVAFFTSILLCIAWQRTHGLWIGWGLHFGWAATTAILLGLPTAGDASLPTLLTTSTSGPDWLSGGAYGPDAAFFTLIVRVFAIIALYRITRDYAWNYTHRPIVSAGYPMDIPPPAAHTAMEQAAAPAPLVQILASTPANPSTMPVIEEHLRSTQPPDSPTE
ncbi:CPBP family intramembrane metalloprotease [Granulicella sp. 5B5]|uniref:CPBP family intramembrane glutamic endopeptidase n=1 Tax=Granulicella sp. 5B5 TaxID=1617967 RepID=UPI0015F61623|nr:CPBP family intramembrane glutamic endopeptidase [Granulicella sp. 5B5]QMV17474.1 CPBP family intramembrane metalloprotease [Granulicella sp. 5B5]